MLIDSDNGDCTMGNRNSANAFEGERIGRCEPVTFDVVGTVEDREVAGGESEADVELNKGELMCLGDAGRSQQCHHGRRRTSSPE